MKTEEFLKELQLKIKQLPADEKKRILDFYQEMIEDRIENGEKEEQIIEEFGSADTLAQKILEESNSPAPPQKFQWKNLSVGVKALLIAGSPVWIIFVLTGFILYLVGWILAAVFYIVPAVFAIFAVGGVGSGIYLLFTNPSVGAIQMGIGLTSIGLTLLFYYSARAFSKKYLSFSRFLMKKLPFRKAVTVHE